MGLLQNDERFQVCFMASMKWYPRIVATVQGIYIYIYIVYIVIYQIYIYICICRHEIHNRLIDTSWLGKLSGWKLPPFPNFLPSFQINPFFWGLKHTNCIHCCGSHLWVKTSCNLSDIPRSAVFRTLIFCLDENMTKAWAVGWWLVSSELGKVTTWGNLNYLAPEIFPTRFIGTIGTLGPWVIMNDTSTWWSDIDWNCGTKKLMATYCNMYYMYRTLKLDLFGELFSWGLPERVLFWILMVWPFKRWGHSCFPCESLRGSVFFKQADCHLLGVSWWSNEQDITIVSLHRPPGEQVEWSPNKACVYVQKFW